MLLQNNHYLIGDAHLGRTFRADVPLDRRGEREQLLRQAFIDKLEEAAELKADKVIQVGDLFDKAVVPLEVLLDTAQIIEQFAKKHRLMWVHIMAGNHDLAKQSDRKSCFEVLALLLSHLPNVQVTTETANLDGKTLLVPYSYTIDFAERMPAVGQFDVICTHEDEEVLHKNWGAIKKSLALNGKVYNGHIHAKGEITRDMENIGSVLPLAHGEDPEGVMYITLTPDELEILNPEILRNACVRVRVPHGAAIPNAVDCLQWKVERLDATGQELAETLFTTSGDELDVERRMRELLEPLGTYDRAHAIYMDKKAESY